MVPVPVLHDLNSNSKMKILLFVDNDQPKCFEISVQLLKGIVNQAIEKVFALTAMQNVMSGQT